MPLSERLFGALCTLAAARLTADQKAVPVARWIVLRLRQAIDGAIGRSGLGDELIWAVPKRSYALALSGDEIVVDPSFQNVLLTGCLDRAVAERLLAAVRQSGSGG